MPIKKIKASEAKKLRGATLWKTVKTMTDSEISAAAKMDPVARQFRQDELMQFRLERKK